MLVEALLYPVSALTKYKLKRSRKVPINDESRYLMIVEKRFIHLWRNIDELKQLHLSFLIFVIPIVL